MKFSFLYGTGFGTMCRLLAQHKFRISFRYLPRLAFHLLTGIVNSILSIPDLFYRNKGLPREIIFIVGHFRSGTSHLLNLMTTDKTCIAPTTYQAVFPNSFLSTERIFAPLLNKLIPDLRPVDNMTVQMGSPQEDEIAMAALGAPSPLLYPQFPVTGSFYNTCFSFTDASENNIETWKKKHRKFICKLVKKHGNDSTLILKSPINTARIPLLLDMYPNAKFIHIHRNPYETIQSSIHLFNTYHNIVANFQPLDELRKQTIQNTLRVYELLSRRWIEDNQFISPDKKITISFNELQSDPIETIKKIYEKLGIGKLNLVLVQNYLNEIQSYKKNTYEPLSGDLIHKINIEMGFVFQEFGYQKI